MQHAQARRTAMHRMPGMVLAECCGASLPILQLPRSLQRSPLELHSEACAQRQGPGGGCCAESPREAGGVASRLPDTIPRTRHDNNRHCQFLIAVPRPDGASNRGNAG